MCHIVNLITAVETEKLYSVRHQLFYLLEELDDDQLMSEWRSDKKKRDDKERSLTMPNYGENRGRKERRRCRDGVFCGGLEMASWC
jgi:hypothetical protein